MGVSRVFQGGLTAVHVAAGKENLECLELLLATTEGQASANVQDEVSVDQRPVLTFVIDQLGPP